MPQALFFSEKLSFLRILDVSFSKKKLLSGFLSVLHAAGAFFSEKLHIFRILDMTISQKVCFGSKTRFFELINCFNLAVSGKR